MKNAFKALEAIERLVGGGFGMDMELFTYDFKKPYTKTYLRKNLRQAAKIITEIYTIAHAENSHQCKHPSWEAKKYKILAKKEV